jgi:hypothetical protein
MGVDSAGWTAIDKRTQDVKLGGIWTDGGKRLKCVTDQNYVEVIGNIHENPELLQWPLWI